MVLVDSDDDEERKLLLSESPSLVSSPVITREAVVRGSRRQGEPGAREARKHGLLPRLAWTTGPSMEADKECDKPDSFSLFSPEPHQRIIKQRVLYNQHLKVSMQEVIE